MATRLKSFDEILNSRMKRTAARNNMTVEDAVDQHGDPTDGAAGDQQPTEFTPVAENAVNEQPPELVENTAPQGQDNELLERINQLESQLSAMRGRVIPEQKRAAAMENTIAMMERQHKSQMDALQAQLDDATRRLEEQNVNSFSIDDLLSEEERETMDPSQLAIVTKVAAAAAKRFAPKVDVDSRVRSLLEQDRISQIADYRDHYLNDPKQQVYQLRVLKDDPKFIDWIDNNPDVRFATSALLDARSTSEIDRSVKALNRRIGDFFEEVKRPKTNHNQKTDVATSLETAMRRGPQEKSENQQREDLAKMSRRLKELSRTSRGRASSEAKALFEKIQSY